MPAVQAAAPTVFELTQDETAIVYESGGPGMPPSLRYTGPMGVHSFEGDEIQAVASARGLEVTVALDRLSRLTQTTLTIFLPELQLDGADEVSFRTVGIRATRRRGRISTTGSTSEPLEFDGVARGAAA